jgi:hypothetical protein
MVIAGNSARLTSTFKDFSGTLTDPTGTITFKVFDLKRNQIGTTVNLAGGNHVSTGVYQYDYAVPLGTTSNLVYEFAGLVGGLPAITRKVLIIKTV